MIANPSDEAANKCFRHELRPPGGHVVPSGRDLQHQSVVSAPVNIATIDCNVVAIGDNQRQNVTIKRRVAKGSLDITGMLKDSAELASVFARHLSPTERGHGRDELDHALTKAMTPEHLWSVVSTVPGRSPQIVAGPGSVTAVEAPVSIVGEKPEVTRKPPVVTAIRVGMQPPRRTINLILPDISRADEGSRRQRSRDDVSGPELRS